MNDSSAVHPLTRLRQRIRQSGQQYRRNDDNSKSLFHPDRGFVYAYSVPEVEAALDAYEAELPSEYRPEKQEPMSLKDELLQSASMLCANHPSKDTRDFASAVMGFLLHGDTGAQRPNILKLLRTDLLIEDRDELGN